MATPRPAPRGPCAAAVAVQAVVVVAVLVAGCCVATTSATLANVPAMFANALAMIHDRMPFHVHVLPRPQDAQDAQGSDYDEYDDYPGELAGSYMCQYCRCGVANRATRIVGGRPTLVNEFPWVAALVRNARVFCGATLINDKFVLTAAHCVQGNTWILRMTTKVVLSEHDTALAGETRTDTYRLAAVHRHPDFRPDRGTFDGDLALLLLSRPVTFRAELSPACLPQLDDDFSGLTGTVAGWGRVSELGLPSSELQVIEVPILTQDQCLSHTPYPAGKLTDHMLCAGQLEGGADSCQGDSGGGLLVQDEDGRLVAAGVVSWGEGCARPGRPGVYTRVNHYLPWILRITQDSCYCAR